MSAGALFSRFRIVAPESRAALALAEEPYLPPAANRPPGSRPDSTDTPIIKHLAFVQISDNVSPRAGGPGSPSNLHLFQVDQKTETHPFGSDIDYGGFQSNDELTKALAPLRSTAREWVSAEVLARTAWLESAKDPPTEWEAANVDFLHFSFQIRVLEPVVQFGLLELRSLPGEEPWLKTAEYRCAPLYNRFLHFEFTAR